MAPIRYRRGRARLRDYGGEGPPVLFVPSLINPPFVLDLMPGRSLVEWIARQGFHVWLLDWGAPSHADRDLDIAGHVEHLLVPLIARLPHPPALVGYCLGGTMAAGAAALAPVAGLATIAAPWHFSGYVDTAQSDMAALWRAARPICEKLGFVPMEVLQAAFWRLDPARTIAKYEAFAVSTGDAAEMFVAMEDWANAGAPLTYAAGAEMFDALLREDRTGRGQWTIAGRTIDPLAFSFPTTEFVSLSDRIVPSASAFGFVDRRELGTGHVGMVVGGRAMAQLWDPLAAWLRTTTGSCQNIAGTPKL